MPVAPGPAPARRLERGQPFVVTSWNLQFAAGRRQRFFYDGGRAVSVPAAEVHEVLAAMGPALAGTDVALLQEVDRGSRRTARIDELEPLRSGFAAIASTPYHRCAFVPVPLHEPMGRVEMHLAILSRYPLTRAERLALPLLRESRVRQAFNLRRAILCAEIPFEDRSLAVAVTHFSAFSRGDGTLGRQAERLAAWMEERERAGQPFVVGGDLNLLPPGDTPSRLPDAGEYADDPNPIGTLIPRFRSVLPAHAPTYQAFGRPPDRVLDYLFVSDGIEVESAEVVPSELSDHLPVRARLRLG